MNQICKHWSQDITFDEATNMMIANKQNELFHILLRMGIDEAEAYEVAYNADVLFKFKDIVNHYRYRNYVDHTMCDWIKEDKVLKWCLNNTIPDGGRNWLLLKNIAIGLIKSDITYRESTYICRVIGNNCEDKTKYQQMIGWLRFFNRKPRDRLNYNRFEVNKWLHIHKLHKLLYGGIR
jgi:hypothetical protein